MPKKNSRELLLDAAEAVVLEAGAGHLTLDAVARRAHISKGGLLYNFPTKDALLQGMVVRYVERMDAARRHFRAALPESPSREVKAYILSVLKRSRKETRIGAALLAAVAHDPALLEPVRDIYQNLLKDLARATGNPKRAKIISFATHGLWLTELFGMSPLTAPQREEVLAELLRLAEK